MRLSHLDHEIACSAHCRVFLRDLSFNWGTQFEPKRALCRQALDQVREYPAHSMLFY